MASDSHASPASIIERIVARWAFRRLGSLHHERRVLALADELFRLLRPRHDLGAFARRMLRLAALAHDVGRSVDDKRHPQVGARMLLADRRLPLNQQQRRCLAYLTRYHRGAVPEIGYDDILHDDDPHNQMRIVLALLRAADALDGRQHRAPQRVRFKLRGDRLKVRCHLDDDRRRARKFFSRRKKFRLLEEVLGLKVSTAVRAAGAVSVGRR